MPRPIFKACKPLMTVPSNRIERSKWQRLANTLWPMNWSDGGIIPGMNLMLKLHHKICGTITSSPFTNVLNMRWESCVPTIVSMACRLASMIGSSRTCYGTDGTFMATLSRTVVRSMMLYDNIIPLSQMFKPLPWP